MLGLHLSRARLRALIAGSASAEGTAVSATPTAAGDKAVGYFTNWGVYDRDYHVKNIETSGSAGKLTHINYAFGNVTGGKCVIGDSYADYEKAYTADQSVDGVADTWDQPLRGSFNQLRKLKALHPGLKVIRSFGGRSSGPGRHVLLGAERRHGRR